MRCEGLQQPSKMQNKPKTQYRDNINRNFCYKYEPRENWTKKINQKYNTDSI